MKGRIYLSHDEINIHRLLSFQNPLGICGEPTRGVDFSFMLPARVRDKGVMLLDVTYQQPSFSRADPFIISDRRGKIMHSWPEDYVPGHAEIRKVAETIVK